VETVCSGLDRIPPWPVQAAALAGCVLPTLAPAAAAPPLLRVPQLRLGSNLLCKRSTGPDLKPACSSSCKAACSAALDAEAAKQLVRVGAGGGAEKRGARTACHQIRVTDSAAGLIISESRACLNIRAPSGRCRGRDPAASGPLPRPQANSGLQLSPADRQRLLRSCTRQCNYGCIGSGKTHDFVTPSRR
jgi:hypothetical protein